MDIALIFVTLLSFGFGSMALGYACHVTKKLKQAERPVVVTRPILKAGGQSDVDKSEGWMPFGEVVR